MDLTLPVDIYDSHGQLCASITEGAAEGDYPTLTLHKGDILNVRNIQGGTVDSPNLDIGAGSSDKRGDVVVNWDVGRGFNVYNGHKAKAFTVNDTSGRTHSMQPHRFHAGAFVPDGTGGWRKL